MRILVCLKRVPAPGARINVTADGMAVDSAFLGFAMSPHEECAVEAAVQLVEQHGGEVTALTVGPPEAEDQLRYAASIGATRLVLVTTDGSDWDAQRTAAAITQTVEQLEAAHGAPFDLLLFGNESADACGYQVGIRVAHRLGRPVVNGIKGIAVDAAAAIVTAQRPVDAGVEVYELHLPAALGVKEGINLPRYPTLKGRIDSKRREVMRPEVVTTPGGHSLVRLHRPADQTSRTVVLGTGVGAAPAVVDLLFELGVA